MMEMPAASDQRLLIVSNRLPVAIERDEVSGQWRCQPGAGGLVTALAPVLRHRGGVWIGWPGTLREDRVELAPLLAEATRDSGYRLRPVLLTAAERQEYYHGFANEIIWPLFHDLQSRCWFEPAYWRAYQRVNLRFAEEVMAQGQPGDLVWVHDYHLMGVGAALRELGRAGRASFFLHIPFPPLDIFLKLPWRLEILSDLLAYELIGFQTLRDPHNFVQCVRALLEGSMVRGHGSVIEVRWGGRTTRLGAFPIGIDARQFAREASEPAVAETAWYLHEHHPERQIVLGVDRLDYTKGIPEKLRALRTALACYPELRGRLTLVQVVVPSRAEIPEYASLRAEIDGLVGEINGQHALPGWQPVHYFYRSLERRELLAWYRTAEIQLTTPWKDGMNLVCKEYCACQLDGSGVLVLSTFAGAAAQLHRHALLVNPHDSEGVAAALHRAFHMPPQERRRRMGRLRQAVRRQDVFWWVNAFLQAADGRRLDSYPVVEPYFPRARAEGSG